ncbi:MULTISPECIES: coenzyme F420-0:L-glutamate ligase [unclassified Brachybacterium]|uniref:coenzyme F420-0:L-glutamate ligase n=1 Tax=unclassified Brachybacterium TaxID=2623841 RepID=UPI003F8ECBAE
MSIASPPAQAASRTPDPAPSPVTVLPVTGLGEIREGDDLGALLTAALAPLSPADGDVLCISTKVVSKALGLRVAPEDRDEAIRAAAVRTVARRLHTRVVTSVVQIASGPVMAAAGVDSSNAPEGPLLLPEDPDACARELRAHLVESLGVDLGVLLTDTSSRVWRVGVGDIALGAAGVSALQDLRGGTDADGRPLHVTVRNLADELAAAADLVKGKASGVPAALVRGVASATADDVPARELSRTGGDDWFRRPSLESVWVSLGLTPEQEPIARMSPEPDGERIARALAVASLPRAGQLPGTAAAHLRAGAQDRPHIVVEAADDSTAALIHAATLAERIRTALGAESLAAALPEISLEISVPDPLEDLT